VSLSIAAGELACVVGPNGAGKSTLINAIGGLHRASGGRIAMDGVDLARAPSHRFCARASRSCRRAGGCSRA
jgi:branched-chain amino acid transport system ATP-binding protein